MYDGPHRPLSTTMPRQPEQHIQPPRSVEPPENMHPREHIYVRHISVDDSQEVPPTLPPKQRASKRSTPTPDIELEMRNSMGYNPEDNENRNTYNKWTAKVQPRLKPSSKKMADAQMQTTFSKGTARNPYNFKRLSEVPVDVSGLTVDEVSQCLKLLHLGSYVERFQQNQVDGVLLRSMNEDILHDEFGCTHFNAKKLMRFIHDSWRPVVHL